MVIYGLCAGVFFSWFYLLFLFVLLQVLCCDVSLAAEQVSRRKYYGKKQEIEKCAK
jgi:hypothetical protein